MNEDDDENDDPEPCDLPSPRRSPVRSPQPRWPKPHPPRRRVTQPSWSRCRRRARQKSLPQPPLGRICVRRAPYPNDDASFLDHQNIWLHRFPGVSDPYACVHRGSEVFSYRAGAHVTLREYLISDPPPVSEDLLRSFATRLARAFCRTQEFRQELRPLNILLNHECLPNLIVPIVSNADLAFDHPVSTDELWQLPYHSREMRLHRDPSQNCAVYSFSALLYLMATRLPPTSHRPPDPRRRNPHLPAAVWEAICQGMSATPGERFDSVETMVVSLWPELVGTLRPAPEALEVAKVANQFKQESQLLKAQAKWEDAVALDPFNPVFKNNLALVVAQLEGWERARSHLEAASDGLNGHPGYHTNLGICKLRLGLRPEAGIHFETARALGGICSFINRGLAEIMLHRGQLAAAETELKRAWRHDRRCPHATALRSVVVRQLGRPEEADELFERSQDLGRREGTSNWREAWPNEDPDSHGPLEGVTLPLQEKPNWSQENEGDSDGNQPVLPRTPPPSRQWREEKDIPR